MSRAASRALLALVVFSGCLAGVLAQEPAEERYKNKPTSFWVKRLAAPEAPARREAIQAIAAIGPSARSAVPALLRALDDDDEAIRLEAIKALGPIGAEAKEAVPVLLRALNDADVLFHQAAVDALREIGPVDDRIAPALAKTAIKRWSREQPSLPEMAALEAFGPKARAAVPILKEGLQFKAELKPWEFDRHLRIIAVLGRLGPDAVPVLLDARKAQGNQVRQAVYTALQELGPDAKAALPELRKDLDDQDRAEGAMRVIGRIGVDAIPDLIDGLKHPHQFVPGIAAGSLGELGAPAKVAIPDLIAAIKRRQVGGSATIALFRFGPDAIVKLLEATKNEFQAQSVAAALRDAGPHAEPFIGDLVGMLKTNGEIRPLILPILEALDDKAAPALLRGVEDAKNEHAGPLLAKMARGRDAVLALAVPGLIKLLKHADSGVRTRAATLLGEIGPRARSALSALRPAQKDADEGVRSAAELAIKSIEP